MLKCSVICLTLVLCQLPCIHLFGIETFKEMTLTEGRPLFTNDTKFVDLTRFRVKKINRTTHVFLGNTTLFVDFGNDYTMEANAYKKQGNQYRKMPFSILKTKFCDFFANEIYFYDQLLEVSDLPAKGVCPWSQGTYTIRGAFFEFRNVPPYFEGDLMLEAIVRKDNVVVNGYQIFMNVVKISWNEMTLT